MHDCMGKNVDCSKNQELFLSPLLYVRDILYVFFCYFFFMCVFLQNLSIFKLLVVFSNSFHLIMIMFKTFFQKMGKSKKLLIKIAQFLRSKSHSSNMLIFLSLSVPQAENDSKSLKTNKGLSKHEPLYTKKIQDTLT